MPGDGRRPRDPRRHDRRRDRLARRRRRCSPRSTGGGEARTLVVRASRRSTATPNLVGQMLAGKLGGGRQCLRRLVEPAGRQAMPLLVEPEGRRRRSTARAGYINGGDGDFRIVARADPERRSPSDRLLGRGARHRQGIMAARKAGQLGKLLFGAAAGPVIDLSGAAAAAAAPGRSSPASPLVTRRRALEEDGEPL